MDPGGIALNAVHREHEWKTSNHTVFMRVWGERSFTRAVRVARVAARVGCQERATDRLARFPFLRPVLIMAN
jgi:hypothetical protein